MILVDLEKLKKESKSWKKIGVVGIDSANLLLVDPAYLQRRSDIPSYDALVGLRKSKRVVPTSRVSKTPKEWTPRMRSQTAQVLFKKGHKGAGVITTTGFGDGLYPVFAKFGKSGDWKGRVKEIRIDFT